MIHGDDHECLDLIALTPDDANIWVTGLMALSSGSRSEPLLFSRIISVVLVENQPSGSMATLRERHIQSKSSMSIFRWLGAAFDDADADKKGYISEKTAVRLIRSINPKLLSNRVKQKVKVLFVRF